MKKILLVAAIAGLAMVSCKKEYTCECTVTSNATGTNVTTTASSTTEKMKKQEAIDACDAGDSSTELLGIKVTSECEIK
jgi:hypothetical protein